MLASHLAWNHALIDGNKRASWASLVMFLDLNGVVWDPDPPDVDDAEAAMLAVAAHEVDEGSLHGSARGRMSRRADTAREVRESTALSITALSEAAISASRSCVACW